MAKQYVNGYDKPSFKLISPDGSTETISISFKYQALTEYYEKIPVFHKIIDGTKKKFIKYVEYEWVLSYSDAITKDDLIKLKNIENFEFVSGAKLILIPHIDYPWRFFEVMIKDDKREIGLHYHGRGRDSTLNKGFNITFENKYPLHEVNMIDPDYIPSIGAIVGQEYY